MGPELMPGVVVWLGFLYLDMIFDFHTSQILFVVPLHAVRDVYVLA
jgi:hypothetical protein